MAENLSIVTSVTTQQEAELICSRLAEAGIRAMPRLSTGGGAWRGTGGCDVCVEEHTLERAREVLAADEGAISDEELARLSEEAGRQARER